MTAQIKAELAETPVTRRCCRKAEASTMLRLAAAHTIGLPGMLEAEFDTSAAARRLSRHLRDVYGQTSDITIVPSSAFTSGTRYVLRVARGAVDLAQQTGLIDHRNHHPIKGLSPQVVSGPSCDTTAAWRAALLATGSLYDHSRKPTLEVTCPSPEAALALAGLARRLGIKARSRNIHQVDRVQIRDVEEIAALLAMVGASDTAHAWEEHEARRPVRRGAPPSNFNEANHRRTVDAAKTAAARAARALEILGTDTPEHLRSVGVLRIDDHEASLEELGKRHDPPLSKDAVAGRLRRLIAKADRRARGLGIPDTASAASQLVVSAGGGAS